MTWINRHLHEVNLTYVRHFRQALFFCACCLLTSFVLFMHALLPFMFEKTGSKLIGFTYNKMIAHKR